MVKVLSIEAIKDYVLVVYLSNGIQISIRVFQTEALSIQEIVEKGYTQLKPHIKLECERQGITQVHKPIVLNDGILDRYYESISMVNAERLAEEARLNEPRSIAPTLEEINRADIDYISIILGVEL